MTTTQQKLNIGGLIAIALLLTLLSRMQHPHHDFTRAAVEPRVAGATIEAAEPTGTISGTITLPPKAGTKQASVCAVRQSDNHMFCATKISKTFSLAVPTGPYAVYTTMSDTPYTVSTYRAYYIDEANNSPKIIDVQANQTVAGITPNNWTYTGDANIIAQLNEQQKTYYRYAVTKKEETPPPDTTTPAVQPVPDNTNLDVGGVSDSEQQSINSTYASKRH